MSVSILNTPLCVTAVLSGEIDHHSAAAIRQKIDATIQQQAPSVLRLDFDEVSFMDSSAIGLVMGRYRIMQEFQGRIQVVNLSRRQYQVMQLAGLDKLAGLSCKKEEVSP